MGNLNMKAELFLDCCPNLSMYFHPQRSEEKLKEAIAKSENPEEKFNRLDDLVQLYCYGNRFDESIALLDENMRSADMEIYKDFLIFMQGQISERRGDFDQAIRYYLKSLFCNPRHPWLQYYLFNNLGFCYNYNQDFKKAESFCRKATEINPGRYNAWKNIGVSLEHQGRYFEATKCYLRAMTLNREDPRAAMHLTRLIKRQPKLRDNLDLMEDYIYKKFIAC